MFRNKEDLEKVPVFWGQGKPHMTLQKEMFCQNLFKGMSNTAAYRDAYTRPDAKESYVNAYSSKLRNQPIIQRRLLELRDDLAKRNLVTVEKVLEEYSHIAFDDIKNYLSFHTEMIDVTNDDGEVSQEPRYVLDIKDSTKIDTKNIEEVYMDKGGNLRVKLYSKSAALDKLGQYLGMFVDRSEITGKDGGPIELKDAREQFLEKLLKRADEGTNK